MAALVLWCREAPRWAQVQVWVHTGVWVCGPIDPRLPWGTGASGHSTQVPLNMGALVHLPFGV